MRNKIYPRSDLGAFQRQSDQGFEENYRYAEGVVVSSDPGGDVRLQTGGGQSSVVARNNNGYSLRPGMRVLIYRSVVSNQWNVTSILYSNTGVRAAISGSENATILEGVTVTDLEADATSTASLLPGSAINRKILALALRRGLTGAVPIQTVEFYPIEWWNFAGAGWTSKTPETEPEVVNWRFSMPTPFLVDQTGVSVVELTPVEAPFVQFIPHIDPLLADQYQAFEFGIPRAPDITLGEVTYTAPGTDITVDMDTDENGDKILNFTFPEPSEGGGGGGDCGCCPDSTPPDPGQTKTTTVTVLAENGAMLPYLLEPGYVVDNIEWDGLWASADDEQEYVSGGDGVTGTPTQNHLKYGLKLESAYLYDYYNYEAMPAVISYGMYMKLIQNRSIEGTHGIGSLCAKVTVSRPAEMGRYQVHAVVGENAIAYPAFYLGSNRWRVYGVETTGDPEDPGRIAITLRDHETFGEPPVCWHAENVTFTTWTPAATHNRMIPGSCSTPSGTQTDTSDEGASWMETRNPMERFDLVWISGGVSIEFDAIAE